jgi:glycosyltransferase involved in cell wall biosynthesis
MRILLLCNKSPWPPKDGGAAATLKMIMGLLTHNVSITVLAINTAKHHIEADKIPEELFRSTDYRLINIDSGINPVRLFLNLFFSRKPFNLERFWSRKYKSELIRVIRNNFDIIQIEGLSMYHYLPVIRQNTSAPVVFRPHNIENLIWSRLADEDRNWFKSVYFRILAHRIKKVEKNILNEFDAIVPISSSDLNWFRAEGLSKPALITVPGYDPEEVRICSVTTPDKVFFIGALDWLPNINGLNWFIKQVWPMIVDRIPCAEFIIAGRNASEKTIANLKGHNIIFKGEVESSSEFIKDKTIMAVPLFSGSGIRMKIIEGMSLGKCIVATPLAAEGLDYENKKNIFIAAGVSDFSDCIIELITNQDIRRETGENAIKKVRKNYNILASSENLVNFYRELIS